MKLQNTFECLNCKTHFDLPMSSPKSGKYCTQTCFFDHKKKIGSYAASKLEAILIKSDAPPKPAAKAPVAEPNHDVEIHEPDIQDPQNEDVAISFDDLSLNDLKGILYQLNQTNKRLKAQVEAYRELADKFITATSEIDLTYERPEPVEGITPVEEEELPVEQPEPEPEKPRAEHPCVRCGEETGSENAVFCSDVCAIASVPEGSLLRMNDGRMLTKKAKPTYTPTATTKPQFISSADFDKIMKQKLEGRNINIQ